MAGSDWPGYFFLRHVARRAEAGWQYDSGCLAVPIKTADERLGAQRFIVSQLGRAALVLHIDETLTRDIIDRIKVLIICPKIIHDGVDLQGIEELGLAIASV